MQLGEIFFAFPRGGKVAPQGRMRGACAAEPREEAITARPPLISPPLPFVHKPFLIY